MNNEELLYPRYEVIADFWDNPFEIGQILTCKNKQEPEMPPISELKSGKITEYLFTDYVALREGGSAMYSEPNFSNYPNLFKKLEWWEKRKESELPKYLKTTYNGTPCKVIAYELENGIIIVDDGEHITRYNFKPYTSARLPATKEDFEMHQNNSTIR